MLAILRKSKGMEGITLTEVIISILLISILTVIASSPAFVGTDNLHEASRLLCSDLRSIRYGSPAGSTDEAGIRLRGTGVRIESRDRYRLFRFNDLNCNDSYDGEEEEMAFPGEAAPRRRDISPLELRISRNGKLEYPDHTTLIFEPPGILRHSSPPTDCMSIVIVQPGAGQAEERCVEVGLTRVREGIWDGSACREG